MLAAPFTGPFTLLVAFVVALCSKHTNICSSCLVNDKRGACPNSSRGTNLGRRPVYPDLVWAAFPQPCLALPATISRSLVVGWGIGAFSSGVWMSCSASLGWYRWSVKEEQGNSLLRQKEVVWRSGGEEKWRFSSLQISHWIKNLG